MTVSDCTGEAYGNGIVATTVNNCYGNSVGLGNGILASTANNCYGQSVNGIWIWATGLANACQGQCTSGVAIKAYVANACVILAGTTNIVHKFNMP